MKDGVLNIYKESGMTSFGVVAKLRSALKIKKIGHTGTLDPDATGVLPVCLGKATKLVELLSGSDKEYHAVMLLGKRTDTQDISGTVLESMEALQIGNCFKSQFYASGLYISEVSLSDTAASFGNILLTDGSAENGVLKAFENDSIPEINAREICTELFIKITEKFTGRISQIPPMYSALKVGGVKLVDAARKGIEIERKPREVFIYKISEPVFHDDLMHVSFNVRCSKGTYIRTLCEDMGKALGIPACLYSLERTEASGLNIADSVSIDEVCQSFDEDRIDELIIPADKFLEKYKAVTVSGETLRKVRNGNSLKCDGTAEHFFDYFKISDEITSTADKDNKEAVRFRIYDDSGEFLAVYRLDSDRGVIVAEKMFI